jgi:hypothetical protein
LCISEFNLFIVFEEEEEKGCIAVRLNLIYLLFLNKKKVVLLSLNRTINLRILQ